MKRVIVFCQVICFTALSFASQPEGRKVILITGASEGIGKAVAEKFAGDEQFQVFGTTRREADVTRMAGNGGHYHMIKMDASSTESVKAAVAQVVKQAGRVDYLVNNAAVMLMGSVESIDVDEQLKPLFDVNVFGYIRATQAVIRHMRKSGGGRILYISSTQGVDTKFYQESYGATKAAVEAFARGESIYLKKNNIDVLVFEPKATDSRIIQNSTKGIHKVPGDTWLEVGEAFYQYTLKRNANGMNVKVVAQEVYDLLLKDAPSFRTVASEATERVRKIFRDPTGELKTKELRKKFDDLLDEYRITLLPHSGTL